MPKLVGLASLAVIAFVAYFFIGEANDYLSDRQVIKSRNIQECDRLIDAHSAYKKGQGDVPSGFRSETQFENIVKRCIDWRLKLLRGERFPGIEP